MRGQFQEKEAKKKKKNGVVVAVIVTVVFVNRILIVWVSLSVVFWERYRCRKDSVPKC